MKLFIKNMVCNRCKVAVNDELIKFGLHPSSVQLGEVEIAEELSAENKASLNTLLQSLGFEMIDDKKRRIIEKIKTAIVNSVHYAEEQSALKFSQKISRELNLDYNYLSNLFSETEGTTIEKYFIAQRIEKVKELLKYDELSLSEIADQLGYSSVAYLSNQFKTQTGFTATQFKSLVNNQRRNLDDL